MDLNRAFNLTAGLVIIVSVLLAAFVNFNFIYLAGFVGIMLFQSGLTGFCPGRMLLQALFFKNKR